MFECNINKNELINMEWTTLTNWKQLLEPRDCERIYREDINMLLESIISISVNELKCDRRIFEKVFREKNREFLLLKKTIYRQYSWIDSEKGTFFALKRMLKVPAGISIFKNTD